MRLLFLDLDGPLLDVRKKYCSVYAEVVKELGGRPLKGTEYWRFKRAKVAESEILIRSNLPLGLRPHYFNLRKERIETREFWKMDQVHPEVITALEGRRGDFCRVLVTLRHSRHELIAQLKAFNLSNLFESVLSQDGDVAGTERWQGKVRMVRERCGDNINGATFIGDTETDIRAAKVIGAKSVAVTFGIRNAQLIREEQPEVICRKPSQLAALIDGLKRE
jgi:phosphoglycolate phosphatase-like HAD superfamily hydrolase